VGPPGKFSATTIVHFLLDHFLSRPKWLKKNGNSTFPDEKPKNPYCDATSAPGIRMENYSRSYEVGVCNENGSLLARGAIGRGCGNEYAPIGRAV
jgi:hypothetical protein